MPSYSKNDIILVRYPFSNLSSSKVRPAIVVSAPHVSQDIMIVPLTSKTASLVEGEFILTEWSTAGLNVATAVKRGLHTVHESLVVRKIGKLAASDAERLEQSLQDWLGFHIKSSLLRNDINGGHGSAVSLQLMVGTRHCRVLGIIPIQPETISVQQRQFLTGSQAEPGNEESQSNITIYTYSLNLTVPKSIHIAS
jgi:mRNA interferase MazF